MGTEPSAPGKGGASRGNACGSKPGSAPTPEARLAASVRAARGGGPSGAPPTWGLGCSSGSGSHGSVPSPWPGPAHRWCAQEMAREKSATSAFSPWHGSYPRLEHPARASGVLGALHCRMEGRSGALGRGSGALELPEWTAVSSFHPWLHFWVLPGLMAGPLRLPRRCHVSILDAETSRDERKGH